jgi:hypothetical protein
MQTFRTTLNLPLSLIREAQARLGVKTKTEAIVVALREVIRRSKLVQYTKNLAGAVDIGLTPRGLKKLRKDRPL